MCSRALLRTLERNYKSFSVWAPISHNFFDKGMLETALARKDFTFDGSYSLAASTQTSSLFGNYAHACSRMLRASFNLPSSSSTRAAATHPDVLVGLAFITAFSRARAFFKSFSYVSEFSFKLFRSVMYPSLLNWTYVLVVPIWFYALLSSI